MVSREGHTLNKTVISLLGGASALALLGGSQASAASPPDEDTILRPARSYTELLDPIPNAQNILRAQMERSGGDASAEPKPLVMAQYYYHHHHHHHHHYYGYYHRYRYHHHHHHHHHHQYYYNNY
jgi:hypothetical protein